jgi:hypothetical protein
MCEERNEEVLFVQIVLFLWELCRVNWLELKCLDGGQGPDMLRSDGNYYLRRGGSF